MKKKKVPKNYAHSKSKIMYYIIKGSRGYSYPSASQFCAWIGFCQFCKSLWEKKCVPDQGFSIF